MGVATTDNPLRRFYDTDLNVLMKVVDKIESITIEITEKGTFADRIDTWPNQFEVVITCNQCTINRGNGAQGMLNDFLDLHDGSFEGTKLEAIYTAIFKFVQWHLLQSETLS